MVVNAIVFGSFIAPTITFAKKIDVEAPKIDMKQFFPGIGST